MAISPYVLPGLTRPKDEIDGRLFEGICQRFKMYPKKVRSSSRQLKYHRVRCMSCAYMREYTPLSLKQVGKIIGDRDHTTVLNALKVHKNYMDTDEIYKTNYIGLVQSIRYGADFEPLSYEKKKIKVLTPQQQQFRFRRWVAMSKEDDSIEMNEDEYNQAMYIMGTFKGESRYAKYGFKRERLGGGRYKITRIL